MKDISPPVWRDGKIIDWADAKVHVFSHALSRGSAIFEVLTAEKTDFGTALFRPVAHIDRMILSAKSIGMKLPYNKSQLLEAMRLVVRNSGHETALIKVVALWRAIEFEVFPHNREVSVFVVALPFPIPGAKSTKGARDRSNGVKARVVGVRKLDPTTMPVTAKAAANYLNPMLAKMEAKRKGADVPIMLDTKGYLAEGATESIFCVRNGKLFTPAEGNILLGITRDTVIELARDLGMALEVKPLKPEILERADEVFFTGTSDWIKHCSYVNGGRIGTGKMGPVAKRLVEYFENVVRGRVPRRRKWLVSV